MTRDWDAATYDRLPIPMTRWGEEVARRLDLRGDETVLDAGCGTGQVTARLLDRLPNGRIIALDGSPSMIQRARSRLGLDRVEYLVHDLLHPIPVEPVDAVLSTATFHWILDHDALFRNLAAVLRSDGQLEAQCGGAGNTASIRRTLEGLGYDVSRRTLFATPEETARRLEAAGFVEVRCWLHDEPTPIPPGDLARYLETICLGDVLEGLSTAERTRVIREVAGRLEEPAIDYVRLDISARARAEHGPRAR
jgi:trans-aconitate 2-methyltransferase